MRPAAGFHHVRVEGALDEEAHRVPVSARLGRDLPLGLLERADELAPDDLAFLLRVGHPGQRRDELRCCVHDLQVNSGGSHEVLLDLLGLARAKQAVVDKDTGQPGADRTLYEGGGDRGVDPAGQAADRPAGADLLADPFHLLVDDAAASSRSDGSQRRQGTPRSTAIPCSVWATSGWNWTPYRARARSSAAATGVASVRAVTVNPGGATAQVSPCDIQTC